MSKSRYSAVLSHVMLFAAALAAGSAHASEGEGAFSYEPYAEALNYVDANGMVDYKGLKANRGQLDAFNASLNEVAPAQYAGWSEAAKIAFWCNAYNSLTLESIINHYPIEASFFRSFVYPENSIRQISGVWDRTQHAVMGREMTLDHIEHEIVRKEFDEPRIHFALVCAAVSCPPLRNEPFAGDRLDEQLDDQTRRFIANPNNFRIDGGTVYLSSILDWYGVDFVKSFGTDKYEGHSEAERAVLNFLSNYLDEEQREYLLNESYGIQYTEYDWTLNEQGAN